MRLHTVCTRSRRAAVVSALVALAAGAPLPAAGAGGVADAGDAPARTIVATRRAVVGFAALAQRERAPGAETRASGPAHQPPLLLFSDEGAPPDLARPRRAPAGAAAGARGRRVQSPAPAASFAALEDDNTRIPPDTDGAVGPAHLMVMLNSEVRVQDRRGCALDTVTLLAFWSAVYDGTDVFDPRVVYDVLAGRWIAVAAADRRSPAAKILLAVSGTSDPTDTWTLYAVDADATDDLWPDFPTVGFNKDWIVVQANMFTVTGDAFGRSHLFVFDKQDLYAGGAGMATLLTSLSPNIRPATTYDPALASLYLLQSSGVLYMVRGAVGAETLVALCLVPAEPFAFAPLGDGDVAPQLGTPARIELNDARMQNVVYRNGALWSTHSVFLPSSFPVRAAIQWQQVAPDCTLLQRGRLDDPTGRVYYGFPSIAVNASDDVLIGFSRFAATEFASAAYAFRLGTDPPGTLQADTLLKAGEAKYVKTFGGGSNRWGDYSATVVDPVNDDDLWTIQEYAATPAGGADRWGTWWGRVSPSGSGPGPEADPPCAASATPVATPIGVPTAAPTPDPVRCQRTILRQAARLARGRTALLNRCELARIEHGLAPVTDCAQEPATAARLARATARFTAAIAEACGGADRACGGDRRDEPATAALGWPAVCPDFGMRGCDDPITDCNGIVRCLTCIHQAVVDDATAFWFSALRPTDPRSRDDKRLNRCQQAIGKAAHALVITRSRALEQCWDLRLRGKHTGVCPDPGAAPGSPPRAAAERIAHATFAKTAKICAACGGADRACGGDDDFTPAAIGFAPRCADVKIPGGRPCEAPVADLAHLATCVDCVTTFHADCIDRAQVPAFGPYPAECRP